MNLADAGAGRSHKQPQATCVIDWSTVRGMTQTVLKEKLP